MVQRRINLKVALATIVMAGAFGAGVYFLHDWQVSRTAKELKRLAAVQEEQSEWIKAATYLERYVRLRPDDNPTYGQLALTYTRGAKFGYEKKRAAALHYRALGKSDDEQERELRASLAELLLELQQFAEAETQARLLIQPTGDSKADPSDPRAWRALALSLAYQLFDGSLASANFQELKILSTCEKARHLNPADADIAVALATIYRQWVDVVVAENAALTSVDRQARADATMDQLVNDNPQDGKVLLARYFYRLRHGLPEAQSDLEAAIRVAPDNAEVLLAAGAQALDDGQRLKQEPATAEASKLALEKARSYFQKLVALPTDEQNPAAHLGLGEARLLLGQRDEAIAAWRDGLKHFQAPAVKIGLYVRIADVLLESDDFDQAQDSVDKIDEYAKQLGVSVKREYKLAVSRDQELRKAILNFRRGELAAAVPLLRTVIVRQPQGDTRVETTVRAWLLLANIQYRLGDWVEAAAAFDQAASLQPSMQQPRLVAAQAYLFAGRPSLAAERAEEALALGSNVEAWLVLASAQFQLQLFQPAASRRWSRFEQALATLEAAKAQLSEAQPWRIDFLRVDHVMAQARQSDKQAEGVAEAARLLSEAEKAFAKEPAFWLQLCVAYQNLGLAADADRALAQCQSTGAKPVAVAATAARLATMRSDYAGARKILEDASSSVSVSERYVLQNELLRVAFAAKDIATARNILTEQHRRQPKDLTLIRRLAELELEQGQHAAAEAWERVAATEGGLPGQTLARYLRAARLFGTAGTQEEPLKRAMHELEQVVLARPNWAEAAALKGMTAHRLGRLEEAAKDLERAVELGDRRLPVYEQLIGLLDRLNRSSDVERYLARLEAELPKTQRLAELASMQELRRENPAQAVDIARKGVEKRPTDVLAHVWLGRMCLIAGELAEAERSFETAVKLAPEDARAWSAMLSLCARTSDQAQLQSVLERLAANTKLEAAQREFLLAQAYELLGDRESATRQYRAAASQSPENLAVLLRAAQFHLKSDVAQAERVLRQAMALDGKSLAARRMLAIALAAQGDQKLEEAQQLLSATQDNDPATNDAAAVEDQRLRALLLAQQGGTLHLQRAVQIFESIVADTSSPAPSDRQLLAQFYERQAQLIEDPEQVAARLQAAEAQLKLAAEDRQAPPASTAAMIQFLVRHDRKSETKEWLDKLEATANKSRQPAADLLALVIQMQLQTGALERSDSWLAKLAEAEPQNLRPVALQAQVAAARDPKADVEAIVEAKATAAVAAAATVAEQTKLQQGIGQLYSSLHQHAAAERWYRQLVAARPDQFPLLVTALARQSRLSDAIALCEEAAKSDPTSRPALVMVAALSEATPGEQDYKQAEPLLAAALARHDKDVNLLYATTLIRIAQNRFAEAADLYRRILAINPKYVPALNNLAMLLAEQPADRAEALELIDRAIAVVGQNAGLLDTKGAILTYSSRSSEAVPLLIAATRSASADPRHHFHLAVAYRDQGDLERAKVQLQTALARQLESQVLMPTDQRLLTELRAALALQPQLNER